MRKSFTRLFSIFMLFCMIGLRSIAVPVWSPPTLVPKDGSCVVNETGQIFTMTFDRDVIPIKGGKISLNKSDGTQLYPIQFNWAGTNPTSPMVYTSSIAPYGTVTFDGKKVIIDFKATLTEKADYYITVAPNSIKDADGNLFSGILGTAPSDGTLTCANEANYGWDFTVRDFTAPTVTTLTPADEAKNVAVNQKLVIKFSESMAWASGVSSSTLADGDIALYTSTDPILGQYGGDVIYTKPSNVELSGNTVTITWAGDMPTLTNLYVRIKAGIFAEYQACPSGVDQVAPKLWEGFNGNGQTPMLGDNGKWNFTTKDNKAPTVTITQDDCSQISNYTITINEGNIVVANTMAALTNANIAQFVTFSGGTFTASVSNNPSNTVITVNPTGNLVSGATVTVTLTAGLWDSSQNAVPAKSGVFTNGDYLAPVLNKLQAANQVGTSFDILANANEVSTIYYVVVKKSDVLSSSVEKFKPTLSQVYYLANTYDNLGNPNLPETFGFAGGLYGDESFNNQLATYFYNETGTANDKTVNVWAAGKFDIAANRVNTDVLERVADLPRTNGTEYVVYAYAIDNSICGPYNNNMTSTVQLRAFGPGSVVNLPAADAGWITGELSINPATTTDVLPPLGTITAANHPYQMAGPFRRILRDGPIYIDFNEGIRLADGSAITPASIANIVSVQDFSGNLAINTTTSSYDPVAKRLTIYPVYAFKSGSNIIVTLLSNKIEDLNGIEQNIPAVNNFWVENYCEPAISWTADKNVPPYGTPSVTEDAPLVDGGTEVAKHATIQLVFDQLVYAPADNELPAGVLTEMTNDPTKINWVGRFVKIREASSQGGAPTGNIIYSNGNESNFVVTVNGYTETSTIITITPAAGYDFGSEMWYNVEVEGTLQNAERYTLLSDLCHPLQTNNVTFQVTDHQAPTVSFFEANGSTKVQDFNNCVSCNTPSLNVVATNRIGVKISEWIALGFDGFRDLNPTQTIQDANALRRYFSLTKCDGTAISFDVKDFTLDAGLDVATMYIDPYSGTNSETVNFTAGEQYTVKFISNPNEIAEAGPYGPGAFADDHGNIVQTGESCFKAYIAPVAPVCRPTIAVGAPATGSCVGVKAELANFSLSMKFVNAMISDGIATSTISVLNGTNSVVFSSTFSGLTVSEGGTKFTIDGGDVVDPSLFVDNAVYRVFVTPGMFQSFDTGIGCSWPANGLAVGTFTTVDSTSPLLTGTTSGTITKTANLQMTFNENVWPVAGQVVKIYENATNTLVATVNIADATRSGNTLTIANALFNTFLAYGKTYYAQFNAGLVRDNCGNLTTSSVLDKLGWVFTIEADPAPEFVCNGFAPTGNVAVQNLTPTFQIKFTEPVVPVAGKQIDIYEELPSSAIANLGNFFATSMTASADKKTYTIPYSAITSLKPSLTYGNCYHLNIAAGAFREENGLQVTGSVVSFETANTGSETTCTWDFCEVDVIQPTVTFWPANNYKNVPLNAYLFGYISEPVKFDAGFAFTEANAKASFRLERLLTGSTTNPTSVQAIDFRLDAVGTFADKQRVMITPLDPQAPDFAGNNNPTMKDDSWYRLSFVQPGALGNLEDNAGNDVVTSSVWFQTEDITCPVTVSTSTSTVTSGGFKFKVKLDEAGTVTYKVVKAGAGSSATAVATGTGTVVANTDKEFTVTGIDANQVSGYDYEVWIQKKDDESDKYDTDAEILAEWPYTMTPSWNLETVRIKDLRPSPNVCSWEKIATVSLCDDDVPTIAGRYPAIAAPAVPVNDNITLLLNEIVAFGAAQPALTPNQIALRDYENNLTVSATITLASTATRTTITINPDAPLMDQHRYYVTWDRYAILDVVPPTACTAPGNYLAELIDKTWWFKTKDNTSPAILCNTISPAYGATCVEQNADLSITVQDGNDVVVNTALTNPFIEIYEQGVAIPHERIPLSSAVKVDNGDGTYTFTFPTAYFYLSGKCYTAAIPAGLFKDSFNNLSAAPGCSWNFCARDYEAPIASWTVTADYSYMYAAQTDPLYTRTIDSGDAGESMSGVPTSSFVNVNFNENVNIFDEGTLTSTVDDAWRSLTSFFLSEDDIAKALTVKNGNTELVYGTDYRVVKFPFGSSSSFAIVITDDYSHIGYGGIVYMNGSMKSNSTYHIGLKQGWISDLASCSTRNIITEDVDLLTVVTRDDTPPTLTMKDANGVAICDAACAAPIASYGWNNNQPNNNSGWSNWSPVWPGQGTATMCNTCVAPDGKITLEFNKPVVKTPTELINNNPFWWEGVNGVAWWTQANLGLTPADFADPTTSKYIKIQKWNGSSFVNVASDFIDHAVVTNNQTIDLYFEESLASEGIYAITFAPYTVKDQIRVPDGNEFLGLTCVFQVVDHQAPQVKKFIYTPEPLACISGDYPMDLATETELSILFDEPVQPGTGKLIIRRENGQQQQIIDASQITVDEDNDQLIHLNNVAFEENTLYYVEIQPGFITDQASCGVNAYAGIDPEDSTPGWQAQIPSFKWVFKTGDNTPPTPLTLTPNRTNDVSRETNLEIVFDENISTSCTCDNKSATIPMTWNGTSPGKGFYIYANNGSTPDADFGNFVEFIPWNSGLVTISGTDIYNGKTADKVTINPTTVFQKNMIYYVRVSGGIYCDGFANYWGGIGDSTTWKFTITNDVAPEIASFTPEFESTVEARTDGYVVTDLTMTFVDKEEKEPLLVKPGAGAVKIFEYIYNPVTLSYEEKLWKSIDIKDPSVVFSGNTVTINDVMLKDDVNPQSCNGPRMYYVTVSSGAVTNGYPGSLTYWEGFNDAFDWRFYTGADNTFMMPNTIVKPVATNLSIPAASTLQISFAENIQAIPNTTKKVKIYNAKTDAVVDQFTVVPAHITGNTLTLVSNMLVDETSYYVIIEEGAFGDTSSCSTPFPGISDKSVWTFSTGDNTAPVPAWASTLGTCEGTCATVTFSFNETYGVKVGTGMINLWVNGTKFASAPAVQGTDINKVSAVFCNLPDKTTFAVSVDASTVIDNGNNSLPNVAVANAAWTFATGDNTAPVINAWAPVVTNAESTVTITITASEAITPVAGKKVVIANGSPAHVYDVTSMVASNDGKTYSLLVGGLSDTTTFNVTVEEGAFQDLGCKPNKTAVAAWSFTTDDNTAPVVTATTPVAGGILPSYIGMAVNFTFNEPVAVGTGTITITRGTNVLSIPVTSEKVVVEGAKVTLVLEDMLYFGAVTVAVPQGGFVDKANQPNGNVAKSWNFTIFDETAPNCITIVNPTDGKTGVLKNVVLEMSFCERVAAGNAAKKLNVYSVLEVQGQLASNTLFYSTPITSAMISGSTVKVPLSGLTDNTSYTVMIDADAIRDEAGNSFEGITDPIKWNFTTGDNTAPTVELVPAAATNKANQFVVNAIFSEEVVGAIEKIVVANSEAKTITTTDNKTFAITITAMDSKVVTVTVPVTITDKVDAKGYGNPLAEQVVGTYVIGDNTAPTVQVTKQPADVSNTTNNFAVELTFSEKVTGVAGALASSTGLVSVTTTDNVVYTATFTGVDLADVKLVLDKNAVKDVSENMNPLAEGLSVTYKVGDHVNPTATVSPETATNAKNSWNVVVTFSEAVVVPSNGITVVGGVASVTNAGNVYTVTITANDLAVVKLKLNTTITDASANANPLAAAEYTYTVGDNTKPTVIVTGPATPIQTNFIVSYTFDEAVTGFANAVTVVNGEAKQIVGSGKDYFVSITAAEKAEVKITVSDAVVDAAGNKFAGNVSTFTVGDFTAPTLVSNVPASGLTINDNHPKPLSFTLSEAVKLSTAGGSLKITKVGATTASVTVPLTSAMISGSVVSVTYTSGLDKNTDYFVTVDANALEDLAGNKFAGITASNTWTFKTGANFATPVNVVNGSLKVYPNPFVDYVNVVTTSEMSKVVVTNIAGQVVKEVVNPSNTIQLDGLRSGVYFISIYDRDAVIGTAKIVKR